MAKDLFSNRLKKLFSQIESAAAESTASSEPALEVPASEALRARADVVEGQPPAAQQPLPAAEAVEPAAEPSGLDVAVESLSYPGEGPSVLSSEAGERAGGAELDVSIIVTGQEIGKQLLETNHERLWKDEDLELMVAVAQQLAQKIETLRQLDESARPGTQAEEAFHLPAHNNDLPNPSAWASADLGPGLEDLNLVETVALRLSQQVENLRLQEEARHFRSETEEAIRRLTYQSWQTYLGHPAREHLAYSYDRAHVMPLESSAELDGQVFSLKVREEVIGQLAIDSPATDKDEVESLVNVISKRLSTHLDGLRLAEQREQALAESELLYNISARLSTAQSLEEALTSVSLPAGDSGASDSRLFFVTLDEKGRPESLNLAVVWYQDEGSQLITVNTQFMLSDYPVYRLALENPDLPVFIEDVSSDARLNPSARAIFELCGAQAVAILPLAVANRWVGAIFIHWPKPRTFNDQEHRLYTALSRQAAVVVNNRLLLEQTRKRAQELQTVARVSTAASTILDPQDLLQAVVDLTKSSFSLYHVQVYRYQPIGQILEVAAGSGEIGRLMAGQKQFIVWADPGPVARSARDSQVVIVNDARSDPGCRVNPLLSELRAEMVVPMMVGDRLLGVFDLQSDQLNRFTREDVRTFNTLASQVAVALQNSELYAEQSATVERLRELDHLKSAFLANMSHELRTPLNSILGFAEVLLLELDGPLNEIMNNDIKLIAKNGKHLLSLINDVLDMAKIEAGRMNLAFERFVLRELLEETIDITSSLAREKSLYLQIRPESEDKIEVIADRVRIRQVLINIISNAVKFTETGGITIYAGLVGNHLRLEVRDTGIGIPPEKLEMIFEAFNQVDNTTTRKVGGTGLGLPISRRLIEMHNGRLWAESQGKRGEGSVFVIEMPTQPDVNASGG